MSRSSGDHREGTWVVVGHSAMDDEGQLVTGENEVVDCAAAMLCDGCVEVLAEKTLQN